MVAAAGFLLLGIVAVSAYPADPVLKKYDDGLRYQYVRGPDGTPYLVDLWFKASDAAEVARYSPDTQNIYHLFTRANPTVSQPLLVGENGLLGLTNYAAHKRTVMIIHGWLDSVTADVNTVLVPAFLSAEDVNVIVVDWSAGGGTINYAAAVANTVTSGESVARFINWLNVVTGSVPGQYHIVGHSLGGHQAGIIGRNINGNIAYITALDPAFPGWITNEDKFRADDGAYTEVIHTNTGVLGYIATLGHADFYPNGGVNMPGCSSQECDHARCFYYLAESLTSGGFNGRRCASYVTAMTGNCILWGNLQMGGLVPKTGSSGIFYLQTNAAPPFSQG
ncbi:pancreatic triacylglycerol lipase-like [Plodia interpunctella]|uniref:pancreatic triacylglycerol lipase-like n=1 Tax=Plodia interpunctella TaxID=58824 RepID=UPI002368AC51|nr:pancreatic triacylglycerol lipase-like [Plodia interpunctella]